MNDEASMKKHKAFALFALNIYNIYVILHNICMFLCYIILFFSGIK